MRKEFDLATDAIYLNSGTHSITPRAVLEAVTRYQRAYELNPTIELLDAWPRLLEVQKELAAFLHADPRDLFLRPNVTEALNAFLLNIPLPKGSEILVTDLEYGAIVNVCRLRAERDGLKLRSVHLPLKAGRDELAATLISALRPETSLVMLSHVMTGTGLVVPLAELARETRKRGVLLAVDGAHGPGALDVHFDKLADLDFYGGNLHKWMLGPKGTAFGWVPARHHASLAPLMAGWSTFERPDFLPDQGEGWRFAEKMVMLGCRDFAPFLAISDLLRFRQKLGEKNIHARILELQNTLEREMLKTASWNILSPPAGALRGPLLSFALPDRLQIKGGALLREIWQAHRIQAQVTTVQGRWAMRLAPHIYNTEEELARAAKVLASYS